MLRRVDFEERDATDPLAELRSRFTLPEGVIYLDGNSLGPLPRHVPDVIDDAVRRQWGSDLIRSWNDNAWWEMPVRVGARIASLIGVPEDSVVVGDTTSVALFKAASAARRLRPDRRVILTDSGNFPTDLYVLSSVAEASGATLEIVEPERVGERIDSDVAVMALTHVDYRTGRRHAMEELTAAAQAEGALVVWDLCHSAGAMSLDLSTADMAVGCGYKYLNGGPGAPAFAYIHPRHQEVFVNPIAGWWGHADPFAMEPGFRPAGGVRRALVGTQPILAMVALEAALDAFEGVDMAALRQKSELLVAGFVDLVDERLEGFEVVTPRQASERGSHVSVAHPEAAGIMAALIERGVIGDVRPPNLLRFGLAPLYSRHVEVWDAVEAIGGVMESEAWKRVVTKHGPVT